MTTDWNRSDVIYGVVVPLIVVLGIVGISLVGPFLMRGGGSSGSMGIIIGIMSGIEEMVIIVGVPLLLGLVWNRWAGGASGFLMGSLYSIWYAVEYNLYGVSSRGALRLGPTLLGWVLSAMLIGYMAGALNKRSENFKRMIIAGVIATTVGGVFLFGMFQLSPSNVMTGVDGFLLTVLTRIATAVLIAVIAKVFIWYGLNLYKR